MRLTVSAVSKLTGLSVRTLHYYDELGLLPPGAVSEAGYRYYGAPELFCLQDILYMRELGFPLKEIKAILALPGYNRKKALKKQKKLLELREKQLKGLIQAAEKSMKDEESLPDFSVFGFQAYEQAREKLKDGLMERFSEK